MTRRLYKFLPHTLALLTGALVAFSAPLPVHAYDLTAGVIPASDRVLLAANHAEERAPAASAEPDNAGTHEANTGETLSSPVPDEADENIGFPQLKPTWYPSQVFWLAIAFALMYTLMSKVSLPRATAVIEMRRARRDGDLAKASELQQESEKVTEAYEAALAAAHDSAQKTLVAAQNAISEKVSAETAKFNDHAHTRIATAEQNIARAKDDALATLPDLAADIACEIVDKIAGVQSGKAEARKAVTAVMTDN